MDNLTTLRIDLGINAQKVMQQLQVHNLNIEAEVEKGLQMAFDEIATDDNFALKIKNETKAHIESICHQAIMSWEVKNKITKFIEEKVGNKISEYADRIAENITSSLK